MGAPEWLSQLSVWLSVLAQVVVSGSWDGAPRRALCSAQGLLVPLPLLLPLSLLSLSLSLRQINKIFKKYIGKNGTEGK